MGEKLILCGHVTRAWLNGRKGFISRLRFGIGLRLGYDLGYWLGSWFGLGLGFGSEIRAQGLQK